MKLTMNFIKLMALAIFVTVLIHPFVAEAAADTITPDVTMTIGNVKGYVGDTVEVPVAISKPSKGIAAYGVELNFDPSMMEVTGIKEGQGSGDITACSQDQKGCFWSAHDNTKGYLRTAWADPTAGDHPITEATTLFTVEFKIKDATKLGDNPLTVDSSNKESLSFSDASNHSLVVKAENGQLSASKSSNADLASIQLSEGHITPSFSNDVDHYTAAVENKIDSLSFVANPADAHSMVYINGELVKSQTLSRGYPLNVGGNSFTIRVQAQDGTNKEYEIQVTREKAQSTSISHAQSSGDQDSNNKTLPKTGDDSYIDSYLNIGIVVIIVAMIFTLVIYYRKRRMN